MKYGEIIHFSHPHHRLRYEYGEVPFKCDGCKEVGIGSRFKCSLCDFDLHRHCATSPAVLRHPFYRKCTFQFLPRPPGDALRYCNACDKDVDGFVYHCTKCGFDLHPCCANLPHSIDAGGGTRLFLCRKVSAPCHRCGGKGRSWSYRSNCKSYNLHVSCVMDTLMESWHEIYFRGKVNGEHHCPAVDKVPVIRGAALSRHRRKGKARKCCEMAGSAMQFVISAVLGDPTAIIAGVVGSLISK